MDDAHLVAVIEALEDLVNDGGALLLLDDVLLDVVIQLSSLHAVHHNVNAPPCLVNLLDLNDVGVGHKTNNLDLVPQKLPLSGVERILFDLLKGRLLHSSLILTLVNVREFTIP